MVFLTACNLFRRVYFGRPDRGPDKFWRIQQYLRFSWRFTGRKRNCYRIGLRYIDKALMYSTVGRKIKKQEMSQLWNERLEAAAAEHGLERRDFLEGLARSYIQLDRKVLTDLAIYEPRTFQSLTEVAKKTLDEQGIASVKPLRPV